MTISQSNFIRQAHARAQENQPETRRRVNSGISALFGTGFLGAVAMAGLDIAPWWVMVIAAAVLAVVEVLSQAFSKGPITSSQVEKLATAAEELEAEANPEPSPLETRVAELAGTVDKLTTSVERLHEQHALESEAATIAAQPDPVDMLRAEAEAHLG